MALLVFDGDCAFCSRCAEFAARWGIKADIHPWQRLDLAAAGVSEERARREVLWLGDDGVVSGGAAAIAA
ncbi:DUF393 domain-containing protein, partial [Amycolatopsis sp. NPDC000746]